MCPVLSVNAPIELKPMYELMAQVAAGVAVWAQARADGVPLTPMDALMARLRHPVRWAFRHPIVSVRRKLDRRR